MKYTMSIITYTSILSILALIGSGIFFAHRYEWIIIAPTQSHLNIEHFKQGRMIAKKPYTLYFWKHKKWHSEQITILVYHTINKQLTTLVNKWLILLDEECLIPTKASVQSILLTPSCKTAYISFDHTLFSTESSTYEKYMIIEGLLKTIRKNNIELQDIFLLVHHQILNDPHLDLSHAWPITGFISASLQ